ncbi:hypothetical protein BO85DRAFT_65606 [Aspergillus piperis CBS 112811]|uniref:Uncharacterized protein n=1 Tax=Aspergillus piperis CBS 112811 TaxID=1448313 RepID=A0A8G1QZA9_9EURO|nr:hypothetical protein BO85DRAFT_65606 [Aspergillus piperis CBS 112811]RAH55741.1 hypothetical protein BO85DRAFT_65606 [Aspergillus piperis CBS 112811]
MLGRAKAEGVDVRVVEVDTTYSMFLSGFWGRLWGMRVILERGAGRSCRLRYRSSRGRGSLMVTG